MLNTKVAALATTALASALLFAGAAYAQSTGTQTVEEVVVTAKGQKTTNGLLKAEEAPKSKSTLTQEYISTQSSGQSILQTVNLVPGVNFVNNDPYGSSGGNLRLRSFDGSRVSLTFDGIPLNDTGNYAIYSNQQLDAELIRYASVNLGTTDVDSPTASATGGTINYTVRKPSQDFGGLVTVSGGSFNYRRIFGLVDTGAFGPMDTTAWVSGSYQKYDKFKGPGELEKKQFNARIYQPLGDNGDFVSVSAHYNENRNAFYRNITLSQYKANPDLENFSVCNLPSHNPGVNAVENDNQGSSNNIGDPAGCSNYYNLRVNPSNTGNIRGQSRFTLADNLHLTVDPSFQYTLANGGGTTTVSESGTSNLTRQMQGSSFSAGGFDLNGDGDTKDTVRYYTPNNTNTRRYGVTSSLIWDITPSQRLRFAYTYDRGAHRQTGEWSPLDDRGNPADPFGGKDGHGPRVYNKDGYFMRQRDRLSIASLNQFAVDYNGKFFDDTLRVNAGVRLPKFERELTNYCYTNSSGFGYCTTENIDAAATAADPDGYIHFVGHSASDKYLAPFHATRKYDKLLPNVGVSYRPFGPEHMFYVSYAEGFSAPKTDSLYAFGNPSKTQFGIPDVQPEMTKSYDLGYRYAGAKLLASAAIWKSDYSNRILSSFDDNCSCFIERNVGPVNLNGLDLEAGYKITPRFSLYGSFSYVHSEVQNDVAAGVGTIDPDGAGPLPPITQTKWLPTAGKQLVEVPERTAAMRAQYEVAGFTFGLQGKWVGDRFSTDVNDEVAPSYKVFDADVRYDLGKLGIKGSFIQLNVMNLLDENYLGNISSKSNAVAIPTPVGNISAASPTYSVGAPRTVMITLRGAF